MTEPSGSSRFSEWVSVPEGKSLETLSGEVVHEDATSMLERISRAWITPVEDLTCEQVRLLLGQDMVFPWLTRPVCEFVLRWPRAEITFYAGDFSAAALRVFRSLLEHEPVLARKVAALEFGFYEDWIEVDPSIAREKNDLVLAARRDALGHS